jgi:hypothetical protein
MDVGQELRAAIRELRVAVSGDMEVKAFGEYNLTKKILNGLVTKALREHNDALYGALETLSKPYWEMVRNLGYRYGAPHPAENMDEGNVEKLTQEAILVRKKAQALYRTMSR